MNIARDLTNRLTELLHREHLAMADFLVALADFDRARHWEALGYRSLFSFLRRELRLSAGGTRRCATFWSRRFEAPPRSFPLRPSTCRRRGQHPPTPRWFGRPN